MTASYDPDNIFAKILRGEIPAHRVYEDADTIAVMDLMPHATGHTLVIAKAPSRNLFDASPENLGAIMRTVQKVARAAKAAFGADGIVISQFNEAPAGQTIFHLHFHVIPRFEGVPLRRHETVEDDAVLAANAEKLRKAL
jgi:histidine triad (HIT) family protein